MSDKATVQTVLNYAYFYLKFRPRTQREVRDYLVKKAQQREWPPELIEQAIARLTELNYLNDADFVSWFVESRNRSRPKSRLALTGELLRKGVEREIIAEYFAAHQPDSESLILRLLAKRWSRYQYLDPRSRFNKAASFLARQGFAFDLIKKCIAQMEEKE